ncbi:hypothetical protein OS493_029836 [Desmophyllum pertusum]|uniref:Uncharacterized protein n=1 Tax=Desmophyllum pertusum TaxID=174260 RepID=A0A9W9YK57_9CNID|nr:hypothetical protein OS493_029836 [Desmophyllum pertusum]
MADYQTLVEETDHIVDDERAKKPVTGAEKASVEPNIISASATQAKNPAVHGREKTDRHVHDDVESAKRQQLEQITRGFGAQTFTPASYDKTQQPRKGPWLLVVLLVVFPLKRDRILTKATLGHPSTWSCCTPSSNGISSSAGQWFAPVSGTIKSKNLSRKAWRLAYSVYQAAVVAFMWSFFLYSMGIFSPLRTLEEVDWLCPLTDIKNMAYGLCWIVNQHTGLAFFLWSNLEDLLKQLSITTEDIRKRASSSSIFWFMVWSVILLFTVPIGLHVAQMVMPDFIVSAKLQRRQDHSDQKWNRFFALPVFYAFLNMLFFLKLRSGKFKEELESWSLSERGTGQTTSHKGEETHQKTRRRRFVFFLTLYNRHASVDLSTGSFLHRRGNRDGDHLESHGAFPTSQRYNQLTGQLTGQLTNFGSHSRTYQGFSPQLAWKTYKLKTQEIIVTAILDITQNVVLYALPLYKMSTLKSCLKSVLEAVEDSDYGEQRPQQNTGHEQQDNSTPGKTRKILKRTSGITALPVSECSVEK